MSVIGSNILAGASGQGGGYNLTKSLRFRSSASAYLNRTLGVSGSGTTWTFSTWVKRGKLGVLQKILATSYTSTSEFYLFFNSSDQIQYGSYTAGGASNNFSLITTQVFRDPSAWYQIVFVWDTTQATSSDRVKMYVNGVQVTAFGTATYPTPNYSGIWNNSSWTHYIGADASSSYFDGYLAEVNFIDGLALTPSSFGETSTTTGVWIPKKYTGTYGTNGFYLPFTDNSALTTSSNVGLGKDFSGNANYWVTNNISITAGSTYDSMTDVPTLTSATVANYCVLNPLDKNSSITLSNGNLTATGGSNVTTRATYFVSSGKWYWETTVTAASAASIVGIVDATASLASYVGSSSLGYGYASAASKYNNATPVAYGATWTTNDVIGIALDLDAGTITFYKNNVSQGVAYSSLSGLFSPAYSTGSGTTIAFNFGQQPFVYTAPSGFLPLNTFNLPTPTIGATASTTANKYMDATLYTGNGSTNTITNAGGFQPDLVWIKSRNFASFHALADSVRGVSLLLNSNATSAESTQTNSVTSLNSNGFSLGADTSTWVNYNTSTLVAWQWRASNATAVTNTAGSITSTVSANTTSGFSVFTFNSGASGTQTVGHGLGVYPSMVIFKDRGVAGYWSVWHSALPNPAQSYMYLDLTNAVGADASQWSNTAPTSSVFTYNSGYSFNTNRNMVAYAWAPIAGYSAFGSYTGNGSTDGTFVYTGFRPRYILVKSSSNASTPWQIFDTSTSPYNTATNNLIANGSNAEPYDTASPIDFLSNGFKLRGGSSSWNNYNTGTWIYACFAESPFKYANAR